jgi:hypothetical protein
MQGYGLYIQGSERYGSWGCVYGIRKLISGFWGQTCNKIEQAGKGGWRLDEGLRRISEMFVAAR